MEVESCDSSKETKDALEADYVVLGGENSKKCEEAALPAPGLEAMKHAFSFFVRCFRCGRNRKNHGGASRMSEAKLSGAPECGHRAGDGAHPERVGWDGLRRTGAMMRSRCIVVGWMRLRLRLTRLTNAEYECFPAAKVVRRRPVE